jgi:hypothetical protein
MPGRLRTSGPSDLGAFEDVGALEDVAVSQDAGRLRVTAHNISP